MTIVLASGFLYSALPPVEFKPGSVGLTVLSSVRQLSTSLSLTRSYLFVGLFSSFSVRVLR